jgi:TRAP transporter TAXI family solute receptor
MQQRLAALFALAAFGALVLWGLNWRDAPIAGGNGGRVSFQVATGPSGGTFFTIGQAMAGIISHPPGMGRCETSMVCGPSGLILSVRTAQGSFDNLRAVNDGLVESALVQSDMADAAVRGDGPFRRAGAQRNVTVIAALFPEEVHLVAAARSGIADVRGLSAKRVWLGAPGTDAGITARRILAAFHVSVRVVEGDDPDALLEAGKIDAFFLTAAAPFGPVSQALADGKAGLVPIEGAAVERLLRQEPQLQHAVIAAQTYPRAPAINTIATRTLWVVNRRVPDALVYGVTRALFNPANHDALAAGHPSAHKIALTSATLELPAPLHAGARRYFREVGVLAR